jgi:predicted MPP superfamily phosphohydrolase
MKQSMMILFVLIALAVIGGISYYMFSRGMKALEGSDLQPYFSWTFWILIATFVVGQIFERGDPGMFAITISRIGSISLAFFLYLLLFVIFVDLVRVFQHFFHFIPESITTGILSGKMLFVYGVSIAALVTIGGAINARNPIIQELDLAIDKKCSQNEKLKVVLATDVHLGVMLGQKHAQKLVNQINEQNPDIVLFGGDLVDHNPNPVMKFDMGRFFDQIEAKVGVFATTGNHEFMGKPDVTTEYFESHGITYIRDSLFTIDGVVHILGRDDKDKSQMTGEERKSIESILSENELSLPLLLLDHQPVEYEIAAKYGVGLMMSGHTHKGQLWPLSFITNLVYENHFGLMQKGNSWFYTSSGYGTWGPPVRTGNRPELVVFNIALK